MLFFNSNKNIDTTENYLYTNVISALYAMKYITNAVDKATKFQDENLKHPVVTGPKLHSSMYYP